MARRSAIALTITSSTIQGTTRPVRGGISRTPPGGARAGSAAARRRNSPIAAIPSRRLSAGVVPGGTGSGLAGRRPRAAASSSAFRLQRLGRPHGVVRRRRGHAEREGQRVGHPQRADDVGGRGGGRGQVARDRQGRATESRRQGGHIVGQANQGRAHIGRRDLGRRRRRGGGRRQPVQPAQQVDAAAQRQRRRLDVARPRGGHRGLVHRRHRDHGGGTQGPQRGVQVPRRLQAVGRGEGGLRPARAAGIQQQPAEAEQQRAPRGGGAARDGARVRPRWAGARGHAGSPARRRSARCAVLFRAGPCQGQVTRRLKTWMIAGKDRADILLRVAPAARAGRARTC